MTIVPDHLRITTITMTTEVKNAEEDDQRYRIRVSLQRSDRPRYWEFHCPNCTYKVCELMNVEVIALSDLIDMNNTTIMGPGIRCPGKYCRRWYYFNLS